MNSDISLLIREKAPLILTEIQKANSIVLHCHPSPDPDSVGSALAMKFALEGMGKKAVVIQGDSEIPQAFMHFPGAKEIIPKNFCEVDLKEFDLFISQDSGSLDMITRMQPLALPLPIRTVVIDHHNTNPGYGDVNLVESTYPAVAQILWDLFSLWNVAVTPYIAANLFVGIYTDTGGFKHMGTTARTLSIAARLGEIARDFSSIITTMECSNDPAALAFQGLALDSVESFLNGRFGLAAVSHSDLIRKGIPSDEMSASVISGILRTVKQWDIAGALIEIEPNLLRASFRSHNGDAFDVSKLAMAFGGGGHKAAAGATVAISIEQAKVLVVAKAKELYNL